MWHTIHRILLLKIILLATSLLSSSFTFSQIPTDQDCLGAIAVCQATYYTEISYSGTGNYLNEINPGHSYMDLGELNVIIHQRQCRIFEKDNTRVKYHIFNKLFSSIKRT
jgi:hypothetical protein